jgi:hypothetical protein
MKIILTESQEQMLQMDELRSGFMNHIVQKSKEIYGQEWPEYVLLDWVYKNAKKLDNGYIHKHQDIRNIVSILMERFLKIYGPGHWVSETIDININSFERSTREILRSRKSSVKDGKGRDDVPQDYDRHIIQKDIIKKTGSPSKEPIIVIETPDGYDLLEGYHRTIQSLIEFGEYKTPAWVYTKN